MHNSETMGAVTPRFPALVYAPFNFLAPPHWRALVKLAALKHGVSPADIMGKARFAHIVRARHEAIHLVYMHCNRGSNWIGERFGIDHTSILHAVRKIEGMPARGGNWMKYKQNYRRDLHPRTHHAH